MKTDLQTVILVILTTWTLGSLAFGWLLVASEKARKERQKIKFPYEVEIEEENEN